MFKRLVRLLILLSLIVVALVQTQNIPYQSFSGNIPQWIGTFRLTTSSLIVTITWNDATAAVGMRLGINQTSLQCIQDTAVSPYVCTLNNLFPRQYAYTVVVTKPSTLTLAVQYSLRISDGTNIILQISGYVTASRLTKFITYIPFYNVCRARFTYTSSIDTNITLYKPSNIGPAARPNYIYDASLTNTFDVPIYQTGKWLFIVATNLVRYQFSLTITTYCDNACINPISSANLPLLCPVTNICGDAKLSSNQQCDNGNKTGCSTGCLIDFGYDCYGTIGTTSYCVKLKICGDGIVDIGEQCDNRNKAGCTACIIDPGYNCSALVGQPSICTICGNGIVESNQQCDNFNQTGCKNCKVDTGFSCRNISPSICTRNNPVCGNGAIQIGEGCDDGNLVAGDGCNQFCNIETGFRCSGALDQLSSCVRITSTIPLCGNGIYEPIPVPADIFSNNPLYGQTYPGFIQQCDNGNQAGCFGCLIQTSYNCISVTGQRSVCNPLVVVPTCGNGIYEPLLGQMCDDGNIVNGDGCNTRCQIQYGWECPNNKNCTRISPIIPTPSSSFCGNGITQTTQQCDDGYQLKNGDGCNTFCRVQSGWVCNNLGVSKCTKI